MSKRDAEEAGIDGNDVAPVAKDQKIAGLAEFVPTMPTRWKINDLIPITIECDRNAFEISRGRAIRFTNKYMAPDKVKKVIESAKRVDKGLFWPFETSEHWGKLYDNEPYPFIHFVFESKEIPSSAWIFFELPRIIDNVKSVVFLHPVKLETVFESLIGFIKNNKSLEQLKVVPHNEEQRQRLVAAVNTATNRPICCDFSVTK